MKYLITKFLPIFILVWSIIYPNHSRALSELPYVDSSQTLDSTMKYKISLLTCGVGEELYASFGHTGLRVIHLKSGKDEVYNYGTFDFEAPNFILNFTLGKLNYWVEKSSFSKFVSTYKYEGRSVKEQVLQLTPLQAEQLINFLENNIKPENKYYKYDFIFDNCATRVRDVMEDALGTSFEWGAILRGKEVSYRQVINQYLYNSHWSRFGINILLGARVDSIMSDHAAMFVPDFLYLGAQNATIAGKDLIAQEQELLPHAIEDSGRTFNGPFWISLSILLLTVVAYLVPGLNGMKQVINFLVLFVTGILGLVMLFMWLVTDHQACDYNWNILWAVPTHVVIAFIKHIPKSWYKIYGLGGISMLIALLIVHMLGIQVLPLMELIPLIGSLLFIYMDMYRQALSVIVNQEKEKDAVLQNN